VTGLVLKSKTLPDPICEPCLAGKMHAIPFLHQRLVLLNLLDSSILMSMVLCVFLLILDIVIGSPSLMTAADSG
jgi:hypothetical protein